MQICNRLYFSRSTLYLLSFMWLAFPFSGFCQEKAAPKNIEKSILKNDTLSKSAIDSLNLKVPKKPKSDQIDAEINYTAQDSIVFLGNGTGFLHGKSDIKYKKIELKADFIRVKMDSSLIFARGTKDSVGSKVGEPEFSEGESKYTSRELTYNLKTKKGYIRQAVTQQGEGYIISDRTKKTSDETLCIAGGKYTTCDNHDHPDFYLSLSKGKVKPGSYIVAGPAHLVIEDVPLPIAVPFGFFPFTDKYSSGILMPNFEDELNRGFGLTNGGYYFAINDYMDMEFRGDVYTKGTWSLAATSTYRKRYKYNGNFNISYREDVTGEKDMPDYNKANNLSIRWSHSQDQKANPNFTFSSSVNFSTSGYNRSNINSYSRPELNSENTKGSSISFSQRFPDSPFSLSGSMLINQRTKDSTISLTLPNISISMSRIYPFKRKNAIGKERWYEKISMSYSGSLANSIDTKENKLLTSSFTRDWKNSMRHSIPVSATFNILKYINVSPSVNYNERWYMQSYNQSWDAANKKVKTDTVYNFSRVYDFNMGVSASTKLYGFYMPIRAIFGDKIDRIRHVITPSIGFSYMPDFGDAMWGFYGTYVKPVADIKDPTIFHDETVQYSHFVQSPGTGKSGSVNFSLGNNVEMKVRNDKDTTGTAPFKKVSLIDNFTVSGSYNMAADSMRWSILNASLRIKLGKSYSLSLSGGFDPYEYGLSKSGSPVRINKLRWENGGFPRFLGTSTSYSYTLSNDTFKKLFGKDKSSKGKSDKTPDTSTEPTAGTGQATNKQSGDKSKKVDIGEDGYEKVTIPWSISINYSIRYGNTNVFDKTKMEYEMAFTHNLSFSGNLALTTNWKFNTSTTYDFKSKQFTYTNLNITRSLHCWQMTASVVPFGVYKSYTFRLGVNASMLSDLKYDKQSGYGTTNVTWY
jgi:lipopolysaccharide assembly outer membrane protein LptD (OstA)